MRSDQTDTVRGDVRGAARFPLSRRSTPGQSSERTMHVLLIEDSRRLQESLDEGLRRSGYAVDIAGDGEVGLRQARHNQYDVIILDLMLPKIDGLTVLRTLRERGDATH